MSKRFTDSRKWDDPWIINLEPKYKLLWLYILDKCNHAGIYKSCPPLEKCCLGYNYDWNEVMSVFSERVLSLKNDKYLIVKFIEFQYGILNEMNRVHLSVINLLKKEGAYKPLIKSLQGRKDKDKDKERLLSNNNILSTKRFNIYKERYPKSNGQSRAKKIFPNKIKTDEDWNKLGSALSAYLQYIKRQDIKPEYIKNMDTFLNNYEDWIHAKELENNQQRRWI